MKFSVAVIALLATSVLVTRADDSPGVVYVTRDKVAHAFEKRGPGNDGLIATQPVRVVGNQRSEASEAEWHEKEIDVLYVIEGASTVVAGGTLIGGKTTRPGQMTGSGVQGGQTYKLSKGDVMVIPAGVPHWYKEVPQSIVYYTVKVPSSGSSGGVVFVSHEKVADALSKGGELVKTSDLRVSGRHRSKPSNPEMHEKQFDVYYIVSGSGTLLTGGSLVDMKTTEPGQFEGTGIQGGKSYNLSKGEVIVIPAGTPHWWKEVPKEVSYYVVNLMKP